MSRIVRLPPSTRFEIGQEMNSLARSTSTTSISGSHRRTYFAAVAPPKPAPITSTRALLGAGALAQPATESAAPSLRNSRRLISASARSSPRSTRSAGRCSPWRSGASRWPGASRRGTPSSVRRCAPAIGRRAKQPPSSRCGLRCRGSWRRSRRGCARRDYPAQPRRAAPRRAPRRRAVGSWVLPAARLRRGAGKAKAASGDWRGLLLEGELELFVLADVDGHLAAVLQPAEEQLVGERAADRVLDEACHRPRPHQRVEALLSEVRLERIGKACLDLLLGELLVELHQEF